jgi:hypothetical protein
MDWLGLGLQGNADEDDSEGGDDDDHEEIIRQGRVDVR